MIIDSHLHVWDRSRADYGWLGPHLLKGDGEVSWLTRRLLEESKMAEGLVSTVRSRCVVKSGVPLKWIDYFDLDDPSMQEFAEWLDALSETRRELVEGEIEGLLELAADRELDPSDDRTFEPVASLPDLFELKWRFRRSGKPPIQLRQYHAEPSELPDSLVSLHRHIKQTHGTRAEIKSAQGQEMSKARLRFIAGQSTLWGTDV